MPYLEKSMAPASFLKERSDGPPEKPAVLSSENGLARPFRVGHKAENITLGIDNARDAVHGSVGIPLIPPDTAGGNIAEHGSAPVFKVVELIRRQEEKSVPVSDGKLNHLPFFEKARKGSIRVFHRQKAGPADK
jgi:hypothetical protein